jgi:hypothetical protein
MLDEQLRKLTNDYLDTFTEKERQAYELAKDHLGMSFQIEKSNGFLEWKKKKEESQSG